MMNRWTQEYELESQEDPITLRIWLLVDVNFAIDEAHNTVTKLLVDDSLCNRSFIDNQSDGGREEEITLIGYP